jgi:hypothetical protein
MGGPVHYPDYNTSGDPRQYAQGGLINRIGGYANGGEIMPQDPGLAGLDSLAGPMQDPTLMPGAQGVNGVDPGVDDVSITAQQGEYVVTRPAVEMFGVDFFDIINDLSLKNPNLEPKEVLKAASAMIPKSETMTNKAQPGDIGNRIGSAIGQGSFAQGGLIGKSPPRL